MNAVAGSISFLTEDDAAAAANEIAAHLDAGGLIAYPTETVYGLGGAADVRGVDSLRQLKTRSAEKNFLLLVAGGEMLRALGLEWNAAASRLAREHWPGPLTLVLSVSPGNNTYPPGILSPTGGVAVRWTAHPALSRFLRSYNRPITSTSANIPGAEPVTRATDIATDYSDPLRRRVLLLLDGGALPPSRPSTVIDCTGSAPRVLRHGAILSADLRRTIPELIENE